MWGWARGGGRSHCGAHGDTNSSAGGRKVGVRQGRRAAHGRPRGLRSGGLLLLPLGFQGAAGGWQQNAGGGEHSHKHPDAPAPRAPPTPGTALGWGMKPPFLWEHHGEELCRCLEAFWGPSCPQGTDGTCALPAPRVRVPGVLCPCQGMARVGLEVISPWGLWPIPVPNQGWKPVPALLPGSPAGTRQEREAGCRDAMWG